MVGFNHCGVPLLIPAITSLKTPTLLSDRSIDIIVPNYSIETVTKEVFEKLLRNHKNIPYFALDEACCSRFPKPVYDPII